MNIIRTDSVSHPPREGYEYKSRRRVTLIVKHWSDDSFLILYTKGTTKLYVLPGGGVDDGETREVAVRRELLEETGYADIAIVGCLPDEYHWSNRYEDGQCNYTSQQQCRIVQLMSGSQHDIDHHEKDLHDILWISRNEVASMLQDNYNVHHGKVYWAEYCETRKEEYRIYGR